MNDRINIGIEGINLTHQYANEYCIDDGTLLCFNGLTDRRIFAGINIRF